MCTFAEHLYLQFEGAWVPSFYDGTIDDTQIVMRIDGVDYTVTFLKALIHAHLFDYSVQDIQQAVRHNGCIPSY